MDSYAGARRSKHPLLLVSLALTAFVLLFAGAGSAATNAASATCASGEFTSEFFNNPSLNGSPVLTRCDADVNFDWGGGSPDPAVNSDFFTARFTGQQDFTAGSYTFNVTVDDMFRLYVDGQLVLDTWGAVQPPTSYSAVKEMTAGTHTVVIEYGEVGGGAVIEYSATPVPATFQLSAPSYSVYEHAGTATFTVTRTGDTSNEDSVGYTTTQWGDAIAGADYVDTNGTLTFAPGVTSATFTVDIVDDLVVEGDEYFYLYLSGSSAQIGYPDYAAVQIIDNDAAPGDGNQTDLSITQSGSPNPTTVNQNTTYELAVTNNSLWTATNVAVLDTLPAGSTLVSSPGCTDNSNGTVTCANASLAPNGTATFSVTVKATSVGDNTNTASVRSDTPDSDTSDNTSDETTGVTGLPPVLSFADVAQNEGDSGYSPMAFTVTLSAASGRTVTIDYHTGTEGAAQDTEDFTATSGTLTFAPGETSKTVTVQIVGDTVVEPDERLFLQFDNPVNATTTNSGATGIILNDDTAGVAATPGTTPPVAPPAPPVTPPEPAAPAVGPCKITLTSDSIFQSLITYVGVHVTRDDIPLRDVVVYSKLSYAGEVTNTRTNASGFVEYHFWANLPLQSVELVADCDGTGLRPSSVRMTTRNVSRIGSYVGQGRRTPRTQANCRSVKVSSSSLKVGRRGSVAVKVSFDNQPVKAGGVLLSGAGIHEVRATRRAGQVRFSVRPSRTGTLYVRVPNFAACDHVAALPVR